MNALTPEQLRIQRILLGDYKPKPKPAEQGPLDRMMVTLPYCTCKHPKSGFTKRADGVWVKPCCGRRQKSMWLLHGDTPIDKALSVSELRRLIEALEVSDRLWPMQWNRVRIEQLRAELESRPKRKGKR